MIRIPASVYVALAVFALGVLIGYRLQAGEVSEAKRERDNAVNTAHKWEEAAAGYKTASERWKQRYAADQAEAARQREAARKALAGIERERAAAEREAADWRRRFGNAQRNPDCAELMRATTCPAFTDY
jgi:hypothetical protein